jgi:hypothetical protein
VAGMGRRESILCFVGGMKVRDNVEGLDVDLRIILIYVRALIGFVWLGLEQVARCCEHGNKPPYSMKLGEFVEYLRKYWALMTKLFHGLSVYLVG